MAQIVTVAPGDTLTSIVSSKKGVPYHHAHPWIEKVMKLNPHIGNPDRIHPNEKLIIPESLQEQVQESDIWQNALRHVPPQLGFHPPMHYEIPVELINPGDTIDKLANEAFAHSRYSTVPQSVKRAVFLHNNPRLNLCRFGRPLPSGSLANMTPFMLPKHDVAQWERENPIFQVQLSQLKPYVKEVYETIGPTPTYLLSETVRRAKSGGAAVGLDDTASAMASGYVASSSIAMAQVNALLQEVTRDAVNKFGRGVVCSNKAQNLKKVEHFLRSHPKYDQLMRHLKEIPKHLIPETNAGHIIATTKSPYANARLFRKQIFMPSLKPHATKYMGTIHSALNQGTRVVKIAAKGMYVVPIVMGVCDIVNAPQERRVRTIFEEGFGIVAGAWGTHLGTIAGLGLVTILGLGPLGAFIAVFLCASAVGLAFNAGGKWFGGRIYQAGNEIVGNSYQSINELIKVTQ